MIIATFNVNSVRARLPVLERWCREAKPDILSLQETKVVDDEFPVEFFRDMGYHVYYKGEKSYNGVAVACRQEPKAVSYGFDGKGEDEGSRLVLLDFDGFSLLNTYVPQGSAPDSEKFPYKLQWFERVRNLLEEKYSPEDLLIWNGDFNVAPDDRDVHDPKRLKGRIGFHPDEHAALEKVRTWGFEDVFRKHVQDGGHYTFWDYRVRGALERGLGWRVDHIWATGGMAERSQRSWVDQQPRTWERPSDHTPLLAEFQV